VSSFQKRRLEFGDRLRRLRERTGMAGKDFAAALGWHPSKVSKIELGKQTATDSDVVAWLDAAGAAESVVQHMRDDLRELRIEQMSWRRQVRAGHRAKQEEIAASERAARTIRAVDTAAVPGLLQTPDYAREIFATQASLLEVPNDVDDAVRARMQRQQVLYEPDRTIEILVAEAAVLHPIAPAPVMAAQIHRLIATIGLPNVRFGVIPAGTVLPHVLWHGYWIVDRVVLVENISAEVRITDPEQVAIYERLTDRLWEVAVEDDQARELLTRFLTRTD
jgi:transcriptional regulator with XRE-family HTH domain